MLSLFLPAIAMFLFSFKKKCKILPLISLSTLIPIIYLFIQPGNVHVWGDYMVADNLAKYILLVSLVVQIGVTLSLESLEHHVKISKNAYRRFYRFFSVFWIGLMASILANNMGVYWIGLETATLSTVYMIKTNSSAQAHREAWNYMIVGTIAISLILFGIILIYASAKSVLGEDAMQFNMLLEHAHELENPFLFELGFAFVAIGMFIKMGFFPMNLWLANIERASFYPVAALFSGILESAVIIGFFRFSDIARVIDYPHLVGFSYFYAFLTLLFVSFLIFRAKDFMRLFSLSGIEHMVLIALFWISGGYFAALLHFGAHAFLKPALFISTGVLESNGKYKIAGALKGYAGNKGRAFVFLIGLFMIAIISVPPSPMFFSELYGFGSMVDLAKASDHLLLMLGAITLILLALSIIFYRFVEVYQSMKYEGEAESKKLYLSEVVTLVIFAVALISLLTPASFDLIRGIR